jgi:hypothetical protein
MIWQVWWSEVQLNPVFWVFLTSMTPKWRLMQVMAEHIIFMHMLWLKAWNVFTIIQISKIQTRSRERERVHQIAIPIRRLEYWEHQIRLVWGITKRFFSSTIFFTVCSVSKKWDCREWVVPEVVFLRLEFRFVIILLVSTHSYSHHCC